MTSTMLGKLIGSVTVVDRKLAYDPATGLATISATGIAYPEWKRRDQRFRSAIDHAISDFSFEPDRSRTTWRAIPAGLGDGFHYRTVTRIRLPAGGNGYALDGDQSFARPIIGATVTRTVKRDGAWLTVEDRTVSPGGEVAVEQIPGHVLGQDICRILLAARLVELQVALSQALLDPELPDLRGILYLINENEFFTMDSISF